MAAGRRQGHCDLDAPIVERMRSELGTGADSDAAVVERALTAYLLGRLPDATQAKETGLPFRVTESRLTCGAVGSGHNLDKASL